MDNCFCDPLQHPKNVPTNIQKLAEHIDVQAGKVIGRGGETVREIMQRTGAEIQARQFFFFLSWHTVLFLF